MLQVAFVQRTLAGWKGEKFETLSLISIRQDNPLVEESVIVPNRSLSLELPDWTLFMFQTIYISAWSITFLYLCGNALYWLFVLEAGWWDGLILKLHRMCSCDTKRKPTITILTRMGWGISFMHTASIASKCHTILVKDVRRISWWLSFSTHVQYPMWF